MGELHEFPNRTYIGGVETALQTLVNYQEAYVRCLQNPFVQNAVKETLAKLRDEASKADNSSVQSEFIGSYAAVLLLSAPLPKETYCEIFKIPLDEWNDEANHIDNILSNAPEPFTSLLTDALF